MVMVLSEREFDRLNALWQVPADMRLARRIRAFRPAPVAKVSDRQLAEIVRLSRESARGFGVVDDRLVVRWVMVDALLAPRFYEKPDVAAHFESAAGSPDAKAQDILQLLKVTFRQFGRGDEIWW